MHTTSASTRLGAVVLALALATSTACTGHRDHDQAFCDTLQEVATRMTPATGTTPPPDEVRANLDHVVTLLQRARDLAPADLADDITAYAAAIDRFHTALAAVDDDLDALYASPDGTKLAADTSHALTPAVIQHMAGPCGIDLG